MNSEWWTRLRRPVLLTVILIGLVLPATRPFWQPDFIFTADLHLHLWRVYELDRALGQGALYPRWAPDLYSGYGSPVFNFYPPLAYYLIEFVHLLGFDLVNAIKVVLSLCVFLAAAGAYLLGHDLYAALLEQEYQREAVSLVTATAFAYSPYLLSNIYIRGALSETLAMAVLPFYFWVLRRLVLKPVVSWMLFAGVVGAIFATSHHLTAYIAVPILAAYVLIHLLRVPSGRARARLLLYATLSSILTLSLAAFYWLPALFELPFVYIGQPALIQAGLVRTFFEHLQPATRLIRLQWFYDYPDAPFPLGLSPVALSVSAFLIGLLWLRRDACTTRIEFGYFVGLALILIGGLSDISKPVWLALPVLWVLQFPWRLSVFIALSIALLTGFWVVIAAYLTRRKLGIAMVSAVLIANFILIATVALRVEPWFVPASDALDLAVLARYEVNTRAFGMSSMNEYLPVWTQKLPTSNPQDRGTLLDQDAVNLFPVIKIDSVSVNDIQMTVSTSKPTMLTLRAFFYPDWRGWIDDLAVPVRPTSNVGVVTIDVPEGTHHVRLARASLPTRDIALVLTGLGFLGFSIGAAIAIRHGDSSWRIPAVLLGVTALVFVAPQSLTLSASSKIHSAQIDVDSALRLIGFGVEGSTGSILRLRLFWQTKHAITTEDPVHIQLRDSSGRVRVSHSQLPRFGTGGTQYWVPSEIIDDWYDLRLPGDLAGGMYTLQVAYGAGQSVTIGALDLQGTPSPQALPVIHHRIDARLANSIRLLGFDSALSPVQAGDSLRVTLFWQAEREVTEDFTVLFQLLDKDGQLVAQRDSMPNNDFSPTLLWSPNQVVADRRVLRLPSSLSPGIYRLVTGMYRYRTLERLPVTRSGEASDDDLVTLASIKVRPQPARFTPEHQLNVSLGSAIRLTGFTLAMMDEQGTVLAKAGGGAPARLTARSNDHLALVLYWRADRAVENDYTVFVHLLDANGHLARQQDTPPVEGRYNTTLWEAGEEIVDNHRLLMTDLPSGRYRLVVGMYSPVTGSRLAVTDAQGHPVPDNQIVVSEIELSQP